MAPKIKWDDLFQNVASLTTGDSKAIADELKVLHDKLPYRVNAADLGHINRPRLYWMSWEEGPEATDRDHREGSIRVKPPTFDMPPLSLFLEPGAVKLGEEASKFFTATRWIERRRPPVVVVGIEDRGEEELDAWKATNYALPPYQFKKENCVKTGSSRVQILDAEEREMLHGYRVGHAEGSPLIPETMRISLVGNTFHCVVVAHLLGPWAIQAGYLSRRPTVSELWERALRSSYRGPYEMDAKLMDTYDEWSRRQGDGCYVVGEPSLDPGVREMDLGDPDYQYWRQETLNAIGDQGEGPAGGRTEKADDALEICIRNYTAYQGKPDITVPEEQGEQVLHLVQDEDVVNQIQTQVLPPGEYYEVLADLWLDWWPEADKDLLEHMMSVLIAFDTATAFAMSFGIAKFSLAQLEAKLVGEIVGRFGRSPNPAIVRAIKNWPPIFTLKQLQEFLGTINHVRPHCGPEYCRVAAPLRALLSSCRRSRTSKSSCWSVTGWQFQMRQQQLKQRPHGLQEILPLEGPMKSELILQGMR